MIGGFRLVLAFMLQCSPTHITSSLYWTSGSNIFALQGQHACVHEALLNGNYRLWRTLLLCRPQGLNDFYSIWVLLCIRAGGWHNLSFILVFEWIHREIGNLERGILPLRKKRFHRLVGFGVLKKMAASILTRPDWIPGTGSVAHPFPAAFICIFPLRLYLHAFWVKLAQCDDWCATGTLLIAANHLN